MMGLSIAYEARNQVTFNTETILVEPVITFEKEKQSQADYGETITII